MFYYKNVRCYNGMFNNNFKNDSCVYNIYVLPSCIYKYTADFDKTMKDFYNQNKEKKIIYRVKSFSKKRKLCNDIRNIIISFLITPPKINSVVNI